MEKGDKVVCIYNKMTIGEEVIIDDILDGVYANLTINKVYEIISADIRSSNRVQNRIMIKNDKNENTWYYSERFVSIKEFRKQKLLKLNGKR